jgi:hypothetical protein
LISRQPGQRLSVRHVSYRSDPRSNNRRSAPRIEGRITRPLTMISELPIGAVRCFRVRRRLGKADDKGGRALRRCSGILDVRVGHCRGGRRRLPAARPSSTLERTQLRHRAMSQTAPAPLFVQFQHSKCPQINLKQREFAVWSQIPTGMLQPTFISPGRARVAVNDGFRSTG